MSFAPGGGLYAPCKRCGQQFSERFDVLTHTCREPKPSLCAMCDAEFTTSRTRDRHVFDAHLIPDKFHTCPLCGTIYDSRSKLMEHLRVSKRCFKTELPLSFFKHDSDLRRCNDDHRPRRWILSGFGDAIDVGDTSGDAVDTGGCSDREPEASSVRKSTPSEFASGGLGVDLELPGFRLASSIWTGGHGRLVRHGDHCFKRKRSPDDCDYRDGVNLGS